MADLYHSIENPLVRVLAKMEHVGVGVDADTLRSINERLTSEVESLGAELRQVAGPRRPQPQLADAAACAAVRREGAEPGRRQEDEVRLLDRCADVGEAEGPVARVHRAAAAAPRGREAARHVRRGAAARGRRGRPDPRHVQPDRGPHRPAELRSAEPPQHPGAQRRGAGLPHGVRAAGRAPRCSSPTTTRSSCAASPTWPPTRA